MEHGRQQGHDRPGHVHLTILDRAVYGLVCAGGAVLLLVAGFLLFVVAGAIVIDIVANIINFVGILLFPFALVVPIVWPLVREHYFILVAAIGFVVGFVLAPQIHNRPSGVAVD